MNETRILRIILISFFAAFLVLPLNTIAVSVEVDISIDKQNYEYRFKPNGTLSMMISGKLSCNIEEAGPNFKYVHVNLWSGDTHSWVQGLAPSLSTFESSEIRSFNISLRIPDNVDNRTVDEILVNGNWYIEQHVGEKIGPMTDLPQQITYLRIYRETASSASEHNLTPSFEARDEFIELGFILNIILIAIPVIIITAIIAYYKLKT